MDKVDISTWMGSALGRRYSNHVRNIPVYSYLKVLFFVNRCNHCEGDERGVCKNWCRTNYCMLLHRYCPVSLINEDFIERIDPNVSDVQVVHVGRIGPKPARPKYYRPSIATINKENKIRNGVQAHKIKVKPNGFRIRL